MKMYRMYQIAPLLLLILQTTTYVLLVRFTLKDGKNAYIQSSVVFTTECMKAFISFLFIFREKSSFRSWLKCIRLDVLDFYSLAEMSGLSLLFTMQNNLSYFAIGKLEAGLFQVMSQLKTMTMAIFVVLILKRKLSLVQWLSLAILACGVCLMNLRPKTDDEKVVSGNAKFNSTNQQIQGIMAMIVSAISSGFGCVYNEKVLHRKSKSFWVTNAQLYLSGSFISFGISFIKDAWRISHDGYFTGFNFLIVFIAIVSSAGGLIISVVLKKLGNIAKSFGSSLSVISITVLSHFIFNETINDYNFIGIILVVIAMPVFTLSGLRKV